MSYSFGYESASKPRIYPILEAAPIDGDTLSVVLDLGIGIKFEGPLRLEGIDAPEMSVLLEKEAAKNSRRFVDFWLGENRNNQKVAKISSRDKYGRLLGDIEANGKSLAQWLLSEGVVKPYRKRGEEMEKTKWTQEELVEVVRKSPRSF